jgi:hypothetical protein
MELWLCAACSKLNICLCAIVGDYCWKLAAGGHLSGYPKLISHHWPGPPGNIDAAVALPLGKIYFFKGDKTWAYRVASLLPEYPRLISDVWRGIPNNVDAAMYYDKSTFFFFKGRSEMQCSASVYLVVIICTHSFYKVEKKGTPTIIKK